MFPQTPVWKPLHTSGNVCVCNSQTRRRCHSSPCGRRSRPQAPPPPIHTGWGASSGASPPLLQRTSPRTGEAHLPGARREDWALHESHVSPRATSRDTDSNDIWCYIYFYSFSRRFWPKRLIKAQTINHKSVFSS